MIKYQGKIIEVVEEKMTIPGTDRKKVFEFARRAPGVRALIVKGDKMLLTKEFRYELQGFDYRLPGGKVFDTLVEYKKHIEEDLLPFAIAGVIKECKEEVGLAVYNPKLLNVAKAGGTVVWDLFFFEIKEFDEKQQELEEGEIITFEWKSFDEVMQMCLNDKVKEDRSLGVILKYILLRKKN